MFAAAAQPACRARSGALASTSGRIGGAAAPLHHGPATTAAAAAASRRRLAPLPVTAGFEGRPAAAAGGLSPVGLPQRQQLRAQVGAPPPSMPPGAAADMERRLRAGLGGPLDGEDPSSASVDEHELARRAKISAANKGRTPWNKGRRHSAETIARIKAGTKAAMQRPDVMARLAKANQTRNPHTEEAKEKIRKKLRLRADKASKAIDEQAGLIIAQLQASDDPKMRELGHWEHSRKLVAGLAWQYFKKDFEQVASSGWEEHPEFRPRVIAKLQRRFDMARRAGMPKKKKVDRVRAAMAQLKKLGLAQAKLGTAEEALAKLRRARVVFQSDPVRLEAVVQAEEKAVAVTNKLRKQVAKLEAALKPLQEQMDGMDEWEEEEEEEVDAALSLEQRLEQQAQQAQQALLQQEQQRQHPQQQQPGGSAAAAPQLANGVAAAAAAAGQQQPPPQQQRPGEPQAVHANGVVASGAVAMPSGAALPWQR